MANSISIGAAYKDQDISGADTLSAAAVTGTSTVTGATVSATASLAHGEDGTDLLGFYGITPIAQRGYTSAVHLSSELATSSSFGATQLAVVNEIQKTLVALGVWATA